MWNPTSRFSGRAMAVALFGLSAAAAPLTPQAPSSIDRAGQLLAEAQANFARVHDYTGTLVRQERIGGQLQPEQFIDVRIRQQPFSVCLKWTSPRNLAGQEAIYIAGKNNNEIRAKGSGLLAVAGYVSLPTDDPRVMNKSRHAITETGIGNMLNVITRSYEMVRRLPPGQVKVTFADYAFQQRPCTRMELTHLVHNPQLYCYRCVVYVDKEFKLPVRVEVYDWPSARGNPNGELLECYSYINLRFNLGLTDVALENPDLPLRQSARS
ncbi:MAG TPA: DUF1571 domain-containing protein [Gemmataceae bacterium]|nr:DUF1571 domain-containing protein [Gemmataceae bacterium]